MIDSQKTKEVENLIAEVTKDVTDVLNGIDNYEKLLTDLKHKKEILNSQIEAYKNVLTIFKKNEIGTNAPLSNANQIEEVTSKKTSGKRRMRLGVKKRAIYHLVSEDSSTFNDLLFAIERLRFPIDSGYIRSVIRSAKEDGDFFEENNGKFILTESGKEIFNQAPKPKEWEDYQNKLSLLFSQSEDTQDLCPSNGTNENEASEAYAANASEVGGWGGTTSRTPFD